MGKARKQHYVPVSYLYRFASKQEVFVVDIVKQNTFRTSPQNVAHIRDFYSGEGEGIVDENVVEGYFSQVEGQVKPVVDSWIKTMRLPVKGDWNLVSEFIAGMHLRVPRLRGCEKNCVNGHGIVKLSDRKGILWTGRHRNN